LLADFIAHVAVVGMKFFQLAGEGVGIGGGESPSPSGWERVVLAAAGPGEG